MLGGGVEWCVVGFVCVIGFCYGFGGGFGSFDGFGGFVGFGGGGWSFMGGGCVWGSVVCGGLCYGVF